jgi:hypothetical protein
MGSTTTASAATPAATAGYQQTLFYSYQSNVSTPMASPNRSSNHSTSSRVKTGNVTPTSNVKYFNNLPSPVSPTFQPSFDKQFFYQPAQFPPEAAAVAAATMGMSMHSTDPQPQMKYDAETLNSYYQQQQHYGVFYQPYSTGQPGLDPQQQHQPHQQHQRHSSYYY